MKLAALCLVIGMIASAPAGAGTLSSLFKALFRADGRAVAHCSGDTAGDQDEERRVCGGEEPGPKP